MQTGMHKFHFQMFVGKHGSIFEAENFLTDLSLNEDFLHLMDICCLNENLMSHTETYL